ncbi:MBL fold metallo-hydrolase [Nakamurella lactea]|uniref:MBL fold metallo-hydrolase n=1 Tax=Nakamurella lactea TaxID=459515 RepID=UPI000565C20E|nr:MBL fold metallo-hydrolase [Nakamurella lactea]
MASHLTVLGSCGAWPEAGRSCSGFLLEHDGFRVVLDLGYGTLPRLFAALGSSVGAGIDAVIVTHRHPDHAVDLHALLRARWYGGRGEPPIPLYAPSGVLDLLAALEDPDDGDRAGQVFDWHPLPSSDYRIGPFRLLSMALPHWVPNAGIRLEAAGLTLAYTGDTGVDPALAELALDADLLIAEASDRYQQSTTPQVPGDDPNLHLDGRRAAEVASAAGVKRLMLSHFWPGNDRAATARAAAAIFDGPLLLADEGERITLR